MIADMLIAATALEYGGTGNLLMSYMLEHAFSELSIPRVFIRPAYYYSNWLMYLSAVQEQGVLPTFFPVNQKIPMISPMDVSDFIADKITNGIEKSVTYEIVGPEELSPNDVAGIFGEVLECDVNAQQIPRERRKETLLQAGFTDDAAQNLIEMTDAVINGNTTPEGKGSNPITLQTTFKQYLEEMTVELKRAVTERIELQLRILSFDIDSSLFDPFRI